MRKPDLPAAVAEALIVLLALGLAFAAGAAGWVIGNSSGGSSTTVTVSVGAATPTGSSASFDPQVAAGAHVFVQFACSQCHGEQGRGGVSADVPALTGIAKGVSSSGLRSIIDHGLGESANPTKPYMPVWGEVISQTQVSELIAYLRAGLPSVPTAVPPAVPTGQGAAVEGSVLYVRYGCINCHGPNGLGGVPNPLSPDKTIPPLSGSGFRHDFPTDKAIYDVIRSGSVIGRAPIVSMPHWGGIIPNSQLTALIAYLKTLK
ncbi:MAG: c-type cytochrome [Actinobacteria bacterium]|nr:MAG: c-type cytochrome [Actinomycetota bacterium]